MMAIFKKNEAETNEITAKAALLLLGFCLIIGLFCWTGIFDIYNYMINGFLLAAVIPLTLPAILVKCLHLNKSWLKYAIITCFMIVSGISYAVFTFQALMIFMIPSIIAVFYLDTRLMYYTGIIGIINIGAVHLFTGFYLFQPWIEPFHGMKSIMLYGALPRIMQYIALMILLFLLSRRFTKFLEGFFHVLRDEDLLSQENGKKSNAAELKTLLEKLTEREKHVFELMVQGYTNIQIAQHLYLSNGTVKNYVSAIYDKIETKDRVAIILRYGRFYQNHD